MHFFTPHPTLSIILTLSRSILSLPYLQDSKLRGYKTSRSRRCNAGQKRRRLQGPATLQISQYPRLTTFYSCWTCRKRKVKCDTRRPSCGRCTKANLDCGGYDVELYWVTSDDIVPASAIKHRAMLLQGRVAYSKESEIWLTTQRPPSIGAESHE